MSGSGLLPALGALLLRVLGAIPVALPLLGTAPELRAHAFPSRPITVVYPYAGGSTTEAGARSISAEAARTLGQPVVFENRPGANGRLGLKDLIAARGDAQRCSGEATG